MNLLIGRESISNFLFLIRPMIDINIVELASNHSRPGDELPNKCEAIISVWLSAEGRNEAALTSLHFSAPHSVVVSNSASTCFLSALRFARCRNHQTPIETTSNKALDKSVAQQFVASYQFTNGHGIHLTRPRCNTLVVVEGAGKVIVRERKKESGERDGDGNRMIANKFGARENFINSLDRLARLEKADPARPSGAGSSQSRLQTLIAAGEPPGLHQAPPMTLMHYHGAHPSASTNVGHYFSINCIFRLRSSYL
ncbi:hypothetical protein LSTR_LSTR005477 [Laodelphax striatellus]|uniref:Uncharacterized protein n=1 Tax=Laodelphax striatellus TaxID=195883 RepID=A0A482WXU3_LAOST|nr:hypothetical protein LSTR_LSTR005477 [Laodelphax striatellus]